MFGMMRMLALEVWKPRRFGRMESSFLRAAYRHAGQKFPAIPLIRSAINQRPRSSSHTITRTPTTTFQYPATSRFLPSEHSQRQTPGRTSFCRGSERFGELGVRLGRSAAEPVPRIAPETAPKAALLFLRLARRHAPMSRRQIATVPRSPRAGSAAGSHIDGNGNVAPSMLHVATLEALWRTAMRVAGHCGNADGCCDKVNEKCFCFHSTHRFVAPGHPRGQKRGWHPDQASDLSCLIKALPLNSPFLRNPTHMEWHAATKSGSRSPCCR